MSTKIKKEIQLEIAHVLFIDIVGYSKLSINDQHAAVEELGQVVRASEQFQRAEAGGRLLKIATGDGMALVFYTSPEAPAQCAVEITRALKEHSRLQLRMGIHSGPVSGVVEVNGQANLAGAGINIAQRVMDCGDAGHILLSEHVAEDLEEYEQWRPLLHDLGTCEVKHGMRVAIANLYADEVGNPQLPKKFQALKKYSARMRWAAMIAALLALAVIVAGIAMFSRYRVGSALAAPEKSIAVLPFENRSEDKANAYFADGIQDEILTRLSKIANLKDNPEAYDAYLRGLAYTLKTADTTTNALGAQKYLREAVRLDPKFALGWALLSYVDAASYRNQALQPTVALREDAREAAETALTLQPNLGEALHAKGYYHYACLKDYDTAVRYFEQARQLLPNSSRILESLAYLERRRGQWDRSESYFNEAERLDPRNLHLLTQHAVTYIHYRRLPEALRKADQILNISPDDIDTIAYKAAIAQAEGDLPRAAALLAPLHPNADNPDALGTQAYQAILERRPAPVIPRLKEILAKPDPTLGYSNGELRFFLGWAQELADDHAGAQETWRQARSELESFLKEQPENYYLIGDLALVNMGLGDKAAALALSERAMAANPIEKDPLTGPWSLEILARVAPQMGEPDRAIAALQKLLSIPYAAAFPGGPLNPALLRLDPMFDPLRNDPRFQKLVASPASR